jgi:predicted TIM-barrel fold metal-dependent hydrolase
MDEAGIDRGVIMAIVDVPEVNPRALELIAEACAAYPSRLEAFARIHPSLVRPPVRALLERAFALGFNRLKLHSVSTLAHPRRRRRCDSSGPPQRTARRPCFIAATSL